jgi:hypothetical protein
MFEQHRAVDQLDAAVLHGFDRIGDLDQFVRRGSRVVGQGQAVVNFMAFMFPTRSL